MRKILAPGIVLMVIIAILIRMSADTDVKAKIHSDDIRQMTADWAEEPELPYGDFGDDCEFLRFRPMLQKRYREGSVEIGHQAIVDRWRWINLARAIEQRSVGETVGISAGCVVTVIGKDGDGVLVSYENPHFPSGSQCPSGAVFVLPQVMFKEMTSRYDSYVQQAREVMTEIDRILEEDEPADLGFYEDGDIAPGHRFEVANKLWVKLVQRVSLRPIGDNCITSPGSYIKILGRSDQKGWLVRYSSKEAPMYGTTCPDRAIFFLTDAELKELICAAV